MAPTTTPDVETGVRVDTKEDRIHVVSPGDTLIHVRWIGNEVVFHIEEIPAVLSRELAANESNDFNQQLQFSENGRAFIAGFSAFLQQILSPEKFNKFKQTLQCSVNRDAFDASIDAYLRTILSDQQGKHHPECGGRPKGMANVPPPIPPANGVLLSPSDGALAFAVESLMAASKHSGWAPDEFGQPEYRGKRTKSHGSVVYLHPGEERTGAHLLDAEVLERACRTLWAEVAELGARELQLLMFLSNAWMTHPNPNEGILLNYRRFAEARGLNLVSVGKKSAQERDTFNASVTRLASLDLHAQVTRTLTRRRQTVEEIRGRLLLAEAIGSVYQGPLAGFSGPRRADVTTWRLVPGTAWLASRALGQVGRYPVALMQLDPHNQQFLIRLGAYLGHQTAIRASAGTLAQPLTVRSILAGIHEPLPTDRRMLHKLRTRLADGLDALQERGVLTSWQWVTEGRRGAGFLDDALLYLYSQACLEDHARHHPAARHALRSATVQALIPEHAKAG